MQTLGHVALVVRDYDEALSFFTRTLNFKIVEDTRLSEDKRWVLIAPPGSRGTTLLLARATTPEQESRIGNQAGGRVFLFLHTDDFWRDYNEMIARKVKFTRLLRKPMKFVASSRTCTGRIGICCNSRRVPRVDGTISAIAKFCSTAVGRGVRVVAGDQHARLGNAELRRDDMGDALVAMKPADMRQPEIPRVLVHHFDDAADFRIRHARSAERAVDGRQIMIGDREMLLWPARLAALYPQLIEGEKRLALVDQVEIDVEQRLALGRHHDHMVGPDFFEQRPRRRHSSIPSSVSTARLSS